MTLLAKVRLAVLATSVVFSIIVMGLCAHITWFTTSFDGGYYTFAAMGIAVSIMTILSVPAMVVVDILRSGAFTSMVAFELGWIGLLWVLWIAAAGLTANANELVFAGSNCNYANSVDAQACREFGSVEAFSFLNWLFFFFYWLAILIFAIIGMSRGNSTFTSPVSQTDFMAPAANTGLAAYDTEKMAVPPQNAGYMMPQNTGQFVPQANPGYPQVAAPVSYPPQQMTPQSQTYPQV